MRVCHSSRENPAWC